ncbi:MAG: ureidoglycolate lyase [Thiofilum sp.]|uniref:ureidoglycolate lyase n=1 Tax=Thiofilum sp. TaxID=2212733 RepID=UPI0025E9FE2B|nr:ureidoglycolate lyase [Thiofilum sp.]MBK8453055.1 ureidoglycolate lyase [Thiofilum sp.]
MRVLTPQPLTAENFAPFGQVIELATAYHYPINEGLTTRYHDLVKADTHEQNGRTIVSVFRTNPIPLPHKIIKMERHPLGSQAFLPTHKHPFLVLVAPAGEQVYAQDLQLFITNGQQGINLAKNTWHHFQLVLGEQSDFIVIDRGGAGNNLQEVEVMGDAIIPVNVAV